MNHVKNDRLDQIAISFEAYDLEAELLIAKLLPQKYKIIFIKVKLKIKPALPNHRYGVGGSLPIGILVISLSPMLRTFVMTVIVPAGTRLIPPIT